MKEKQGIPEKLRNHLKGEKEKLKDYSLREKMQYILEYYWLWILGIILAVTIPAYVIFRATTAIKDYWFFIVYTNTFKEIGNKSELWEGYVDYTGYDLDQKMVNFNASCYFDPTSTSGMRSNYYESFVVFADTGDLDAVTMEKEQIEALGKTGRLMDLEDERCTVLMEKYSDRLVYCIPDPEMSEKERIPVGIDISDSILMTEYDLYENTCVLGVGANSENLEAVELYLEYIYKEE
ncbi:MAG: hypothetical protein HUJ72_04335 [Blautia sp.]|nr:hypothetical protein [Blautia sp.]